MREERIGPSPLKRSWLCRRTTPAGPHRTAAYWFAQALELGLAKLCVQMTVDQRAAIAGFEGIGFRAEALFRDHVRDRDGKLHDLAVLSHDVGEVQSRMTAYGISDAVGA